MGSIRGHLHGHGTVSMARRRPARGLSLLETVIVLSIVAVMLGVVAGVSSEYARVVRFSSKRDRTLTGTQAGLERVRGELAGAIAVHLYGTTPTYELAFTRIDPTLTGRLPATPSPTPTAWDPRDPAYVQEVWYYVEREALVRKIYSPDTSVRSETVAEGVAGFSAGWTDTGAVRVSLSFQEEHFVKPMTTRVQLRSARPVP